MGRGNGLFFLERLLRLGAILSMIAGAVQFGFSALEWSGRFTMLSFKGALILCLGALLLGASNGMGRMRSQGAPVAANGEVPAADGSFYAMLGLVAVALLAYARHRYPELIDSWALHMVYGNRMVSYLLHGTLAAVGMFGLYRSALIYVPRWLPGIR